MSVCKQCKSQVLQKSPDTAMRKQFVTNKEAIHDTQYMIQTFGFIYKVYQSLITAQIDHKKETSLHYQKMYKSSTAIQ